MLGMCLPVVVVAAMSVVDGGSATATMSYRSNMGHRIAVQKLWDAWTFQVNFMYEKFL